MSTVLMVITMGSYFDVDIVFHLSPRGMNSLMPSVCYVMTVCLKGMYHNGLSLLIKSYFSISLRLACVCVCVCGCQISKLSESARREHDL